MKLPKAINERGATPVVALVAAIGIIAFLLITNLFDFNNKLFNLLYPKPPSHAAGVVMPTKLIIINEPPTDPNTGTNLSIQDVVSKFQFAIYSRSYSSVINSYRSSGWTGTAMQYMILNEVAGPSNLYSVTAQVTPCTSTQASFKPYNNQILIETGDFCRVHDSIIEGKKVSPDPSKKVDINADGNPAGSDSDDVYATEDWFIHNQDGTRKSHVGGATGGSLYRPNPANLDLRKYFIARIIREMKGGKNVDGTTRSASNMVGINLDNVDLSWGNITRTTSNSCADSASCVPLEFSTSTAFADAVFSFVQQIHEDPGWKALNKPLWANMTEGSDTGSDWDRYMPYLEGGLKENYILNWGNGPYSSTRQLNQISQAEKWVGAGKSYIAIGRGNASSPNHSAWGKYTLAAYLLIADGTSSSFKYSNGGNYGPFYDYPEYYYQLGTPLGAKFQKTSSPLVYRRDFQCGYVELDMTNSVGTISYTSGCIPGASSSPTPSPSSISSATPPILPSPTPTLSPSPTPTSTPKPTPTPTIAPTPTPSPTPTLSPTPISGSTITIYAAGTPSRNTYPTMNLQISGTIVSTWYNVNGNANTPSYKTYAYNSPTKVSASQIRVNFTNDACCSKGDRNLRVDKINIDGVNYQTEDPSVYSLGVWDSSSGCGPGYKQSEWLSCNGYFQYK